MRERADVVIVGAGAAGLMAAIWAGRTAPGRKLVVLEGARTLGAKILVSGGGRCNLSHDELSERDFAGSTPAAIRKVLRRFTVALAGTWQGAQGTLDERFSYSDGKTERRVWRLTDLGGGRWSGRADDVVGEAVGQAAGNALNWRYTMRLPVDGKVYEVDFDDWMFLVDERVMINKARMSKFGFTLGEVTLAFVRR
jgi:glycine/D-amino acid oxidase-like deaminating enzyme